MDNPIAMDREWSAWRDVCTELKTRGIDLNADDQLAAALVLWGERLVGLRVEQHPVIRAAAREEAEEKYTPTQETIDAR